MQHKTYETSTLREKAIGKARQYEALLRAQSKHRLPEGVKVISLCFDDFPQSAAEHGAPILEDAGLRGTFYTCFGMLGTGQHAKIDDIIRLHKRGHDIGCHTHDHINCSFNPIEIFETNCQQNIKIAAELKIQLEHFCYPQGGITLAAKRMAKTMYTSARGGFWGINQNGFDAYCLKSVPLYQGHLEQVYNYIERLDKEGGWLMLYTHDVSNTPSEHGITDESLKQLIAICREKNIAIKTVSDAMKASAA
jgi:peptidoglycan/xylan/chitin deacetylase (PgdA/CDA1 family)